MSTKIESVGFFELTASLGSFVEVVGGKTQLERSKRQFVNKPGAPQSLFQKVFGELGAAIGDASPTIDLSIEDGKFIVDVVPKLRSTSTLVAAASQMPTAKIPAKKKRRSAATNSRKSAKKKKAKVPPRKKRARKKGVR